MRSFLIIPLLFLITISCDNSINLKNSNQNYTTELNRIIFQTPIIKDNIVKIFDLDGNSSKIFKVIISRNDHYTRITITQIFYTFEIEELPLLYLKYKENLFLCYNGAEMILNNSIAKQEIETILQKSNLKKVVTSIYDSRILQFDLLSDGKIKLNDPPIKPNDVGEEKIKFTPAPTSAEPD